MTNSPTITVRVPQGLYDKLPEGPRGARTEFVIAAIREKLEKETKE